MKKYKLTNGDIIELERVKGLTVIKGWDMKRRDDLIGKQFPRSNMLTVEAWEIKSQNPIPIDIGDKPIIEKDRFQRAIVLYTWIDYELAVVINAPYLGRDDRLGAEVCFNSLFTFLTKFDGLYNAINSIIDLNMFKNLVLLNGLGIPFTQ